MTGQVHVKVNGGGRGRCPERLNPGRSARHPCQVRQAGAVCTRMSAANMRSGSIA